MDYNTLKEPALILFSTAMLLEAFVTAYMFYDQDKLPIHGFLKTVSVVSFGLFSSVNVYAFLEVYGNNNLGPAVITKMLYCGAGALVMITLFFLKRAIVRYILKLLERLGNAPGNT